MAVASGVLVQVVLVVFLGTVEVLQRKEFHGEGLTERAGRAVERPADAGDLVLRHEVHAGAVARPFVFALLVQAQGVDGLQEQVREPLLRDDIRIILKMNRFCISGLVCVHFLVGGVFGKAVGESHFGEGHAPHLGEELLGAPEASGGEIEVSCHNLSFSPQKYAKNP